MRHHNAAPLIPITLLLISCGGGGGSTPSFTIGGNVSGIANGGTVVLTSNGASVTVTQPGAFQFPTPVPQGSSYDVTVNTQPVGQSCSVKSASGTVAGDVTDVAVTCEALPAFAYVVSTGSNSVAQFAVGAAGSLTPLSPSSVSTGDAPYSVTVHPSSRYVFVTNHQSGTISQFVVQSNGSLSPNTPPTVEASGAAALVFDPAGKSAYVASHATMAVTRYTLTDAGQLQSSSDASLPIGIDATGMAVSPNGKFLYVTNYGSEPGVGASISQFSISGTGSLTALTPATVTFGSAPTAVAIDATSRFAYVTNQIDGTVSQLAIGADGTLTELTPPTVSTATRPWTVAIRPNSTNLYVAGTSFAAVPEAIWTYAISDAGLLAPAGGNASYIPLLECGQYFSIAFEPIKGFAFVSCTGVIGETDAVNEFSVASDGTLTLLGSVAVPGTGTRSMAIAYARP
jgi:DNA-binding beta-propeller fold protein YncE